LSVGCLARDAFAADCDFHLTFRSINKHKITETTDKKRKPPDDSPPIRDRALIHPLGFDVISDEGDIVGECFHFRFQSAEALLNSVEALFHSVEAFLNRFQLI